MKVQIICDRLHRYFGLGFFLLTIWASLQQVACLAQDTPSANELTHDTNDPIKINSDNTSPQNAAVRRIQLRGESMTLWQNGDVRGAIDKLQQLIELDRMLFSPHDARLANSYEMLADFFLELGELEMAAKQSQESVAILRNHHPASSWQAAEASNKESLFKFLLALDPPVRQKMYDLDRQAAQELDAMRYDRALLTAEKYTSVIHELLGDRHPAWVEAMVTIQEIQISMGKLDTVAAQLSNLYNTLEQIEHPDHPDFAILKWLLSIHAEAMGDQVAAIRYTKEAIEHFEKGQVTYDINYARALSNYGAWLFHQEKHLESIPILRKAYQTWFDEVAGISGPDYIIVEYLTEVLGLVGDQRCQEHRWDEARELYAEGLGYADKKWGAKYHVTTDLRLRMELVNVAKDWSIAQVLDYDNAKRLETETDELESEERYAEAIDKAKEQYDVWLRLVGPDGPSSVAALKRLFSLRMKYESLAAEDVEPFRQKVTAFAEIVGATFGTNHPNYGDICYDVANFLDQIDAVGIDLARKSVKAYEDSVSKTSDSYLVSLTLLGTFLQKARNAEAIEVLEEAIASWESSSFRGIYKHCMAVQALAMYYYSEDDSYKARFLFAEAIELLRENEDQVHGELAETLNYQANIYFSRGAYLDALVHYREALQLMKDHGWDQPDSAHGETYLYLLHNVGASYYHIEKYEEATEILRELLQHFRDSPASSESVYRDSCYQLSRVLQKQENFEEAFAVLAQAATAVETHFPKNSVVYGEFLLKQATLQKAQGDPEQAMNSLDLAKSVFRTVIESKSYSVAETSKLTAQTYNLIELYEEMNDWKASVDVRTLTQPLNEASLAGWDFSVTQLRQENSEMKLIAEASPEQQQLIKRLQEYTNELNSQAAQDYRNFKQIDELEVEPLLIACEAVLSKSNLRKSAYQKEMAAYWERRQVYSTSVTAWISALEIELKLLGERSPLTARTGIRCARMLRHGGAYTAAKKVLDACLPQLVSTQGDEALYTLEAKLELAKLHVDLKDYAAALPLASSVETTIGKFWGKSNVNYADALEVMGFVYFGMNEPKLAEQYLIESNELFKQLLDAHDYRVLRSTANRALAVSWNPLQHEEAEKLFKEAFQHYVDSKQSHLFDCIELIVNFGDFLAEQGKTQRASENYMIAAKKIKNLSGMRVEILTAAISVRLGMTQRRQGLFDDARENLAKAVETQRKQLGNQSQLLSDSLFQLALVNFAQGDVAVAKSLVEESLLIQQRNLRNVGPLVTEKSLSSMLTQEENRLDLLLTLLLESPQDTETAKTGLIWTLQLKGLALDLACRVRALQKSRLFDSNAVRLADRVRLLNQELADLALVQSQDLSPTEIRERQTKLAGEIAVANSQLLLAMKSSGTSTDPTSEDSSEIQRRLRSGETLIEYVRFNRFVAEAGALQQIPHYVAFTLNGNADAPIEMKDLGRADEIESLISQFRDETRQAPKLLIISTEKAIEEQQAVIARKLFDELLGPFSSQCAQSQALIIGPDGPLSTLPFAALVSPKGRYVVEDLDLRYVNSSRDLLRNCAAAGRGTLILSNPNFDAKPTQRKESVEQIENEGITRTLLATRGGADATLRSLRWRRLPGAEGEANDVEGLLLESEFTPIKKYLDNDALEEVLKTAQSPRIVHLATHGFYLPLANEMENDSDGRRSTSFLSGFGRLRTDANPLLRSGIVLAGANRIANIEDQESVMEDGWVTAQEIAGLDFRNTELVVLSACQSGLGDISNGQGVQGIRRAFINAGAHSVMTSLFEVPDEETRYLMSAFYKEFASPQNRAAALSRAQRQQIALRREKFDAAHPFFWASFIMLGTSGDSLVKSR